MKQWGIYIAAAIAIVLVAVVAMHPRYRQHRLMSQLQHAPESAEKARLIRDIIDLDATSAGGFLEQYALHNPTVAFDPRHVVGLVLDATSSDVYIFGADRALGTGRELGVYKIDEELEEVKLRLSTDDGACFSLLTNDGHGGQKYIGFLFVYHRGYTSVVHIEESSNVSPEEMTRWLHEQLKD